MTNSKKKKIKISATSEGVSKAEKVLVRLGFETKAHFAKSTLISRNVVTNFFLKREITVDSFKRICEKLTLNWKEIAELSAEKPLNFVANPAKELTEVKEDMQSIPTLSTTQVTVKDRHSDTTKAVITLQGDLDSVENQNILMTTIKQYGGDSIVIEKLEQGSIKIFISGSPEDIERLRSRIESGEIEKINRFSVENIEVTSTNNKWRLVEEIVNHPSKGRSLKSVDLSDADLSGADLSGADLSGADLSGADLNGTNLSGADLSGADLSGANLFDVKLNGANLSNFDLSGADLSGADLSGANLSGANLNGAYLFDAKLNGANLSGANLRDTKIDEKTKLDHKWHMVWKIVNQPETYHDLNGADLSDADLSGADLSDANLNDANLSGANLSGAKLNGAELRNAYLRNANLSGAKLNGADLSGAKLNGADLSGADLSDADLSGAELSDAYLRNAYLSGAKLNDAYLRNAYLSGAKLNDADLSGAYLSGAKLSNFDLSGADLSGAKLNDANLSGAKLNDADLSGAYLRNADLSDADLSGANLSGANVKNTLFSSNSRGISEFLKQDLIERGAIFEDFPGDRSKVFA